MLDTCNLKSLSGVAKSIILYRFTCKCYIMLLVHSQESYFTTSRPIALHGNCSNRCKTPFYYKPSIHGRLGVCSIYE